MIFELLQIIEIQLSADASSYGVNIKAIRDITDAFCPETCVRQVIIFFDIRNMDKFDAHYEKISQMAKKCTHLLGHEAYRFLLSWVVGGEYRVEKPGYKIAMFNDNHILGRFKERWKSFHEQLKLLHLNAQAPESQDKKKEEKYKNLINLYVKLIDAVLADAHEIRKRIEQNSYGKGDALRLVLNKVLDNIILSRSLNVPVLYDSMHQDDYQSVLLNFLTSEVKRSSEQLNGYKPDSDISKGIAAKIERYSKAIENLIITGNEEQNKIQ